MENTIGLVTSGVGLIFIILGIIFLLFPPKKINNYYGYRTTQSMQSQQKWDFAQIYSSKLMIWNGVVLIIFGMLSLSLKLSPIFNTTLNIIVLFLGIAIMIWKTENALKKVD